MDKSTKAYLEILTDLSSEALFKWQAEIALVVHHWQRIAIFESPTTPKRSQKKDEMRYLSDLDMRKCLRTLYYLSDQELLAHQMMIMEQILPRLRDFECIQTRTVSQQTWEFEQQMRKDAQILTLFNQYDWTFIILHVKEQGDPRMVPLTLQTYESHLPYPRRLLYMLCCRHHAQACWGLYGKRNSLDESRATGQITKYISHCGLDQVRYLQDAVKIGLRLLTIEEMLGIPGISLLMFLSHRRLLHLRSWTLKQWVFIMGEINHEILSSARQQTSRIQTLQRLFNEAVVKFLGTDSSASSIVG